MCIIVGVYNNKGVPGDGLRIASTRRGIIQRRHHTHWYHHRRHQRHGDIGMHWVDIGGDGIGGADHGSVHTHVGGRCRGTSAEGGSIGGVDKGDFSGGG